MAQSSEPLRRVLGDAGDGPARGAIVECLIAGMIMARYVYALEPARSLPVETFEAALAASLQHALGGGA